MNVSDPLWKTKHNISSSTESSAPTQVGRLNTLYEGILQYQFRKMASIADASPADSLPLSQNQTDALIAAISTSGPHLFTFPTFLIVAFTVTFMTIILPLIAGNIFRIVLQSVDHYKGHWRVLVSALSIATIVLTRIFIPPDFQIIYILIFGVPQGIFAVTILHKTAYSRKRWIAYAGILSTSIAYDTASFSDRYTSETGWFFGLTGILPLLYLFVLGAATNIAVLMRTRSPRWKNSLSFDIPATITTHQKEWIWALAAAWVGFNVDLYFAPDTLLLYIAGYTVVLGYYGIGRIFASVRTHEGGSKWVFYLAMVLLSAASDYWVTQGLLLSTVPFLWLILFRFYQNDQAFITRYFPNWMNFRKSRSHSTLRPEEPV
jgi:hypothetical protein